MTTEVINSLDYYKYLAIRASYRTALSKADELTKQQRESFDRVGKELNEKLPEEMKLTNDEIKDQAERFIPTMFPCLSDVMFHLPKQIDQEFAMYVLEHDALDLLGLSSKEELIEYVQKGKHDDTCPTPKEVIAVLRYENEVFYDDLVGGGIYCSPLQDVW